MKTELKEISPTRKQIDIEIDADAVRAVYDRISDNYAKARDRCPVFVPAMRRARSCALASRIKSEPRSCANCSRTQSRKRSPNTKSRPLGEPELNLENTEGLNQLGQQPISFNVNVDVLPEIELGEYKGLEASRRTRPVSDEDVDRVIEQLRENSASLQPVEDRGAQVGDTVTANFHGKFVNEPDAEPINVEDVDVILGGQGVVQAITDNLIGRQSLTTKRRFRSIILRISAPKAWPARWSNTPSR